MYTPRYGYRQTYIRNILICTCMFIYIDIYVLLKYILIYIIYNRLFLYFNGYTCTKQNKKKMQTEHKRTNKK